MRRSTNADESVYNTDFRKNNCSCEPVGSLHERPHRRCCLRENCLGYPTGVRLENGELHPVDGEAGWGLAHPKVRGLVYVPQEVA